MVNCEICGNPIDPDTEEVCRWCGSTVSRPESAAKPQKTRVVEYKLKENMPLVSEAISALEAKIKSSRSKGVYVIKVIHGYGSSGKGGAIKEAVLSRLFTMREQGLIKNYQTGEEYFQFAGGRNYLLRKYPELKETWNADRGNKGMTLIELR